MKRRDFILGLATSISTATKALAISGKQVRVGILVPLRDDDLEARVNALKDGLARLGWISPSNIIFLERTGPMTAEEMKTTAAELVNWKPDLIVAHGTVATRAVAAQTTSIPIVFIGVTDPVDRKFVVSFARPGGNITGYTDFEASWGSKWVDLISQAAPKLKRIALLYNPDAASTGDYFLSSFNAAAAIHQKEPIVLRVRSSDELKRALEEFASSADGGVVVVPDVFTSSQKELLVSATATLNLPTIYPLRGFARSGGLMSFGIDPVDRYRRAADYVDRILKGENPKDLPVEAPTAFEFVVNLQTAKDLGLVIPPSLLVQAKEIID